MTRSTREDAGGAGAIRAVSHLGHLVSAGALDHPDREMLVCDSLRLTYKAFDNWVRVLADQLSDAGIGRDDRVLLHLTNCPEALALQAATFRVEALAVPVMPSYRRHEITRIIDDCAPAAIATMAAFTDGRRPADEVDQILADGDRRSPRLRLLIDGVRGGWEPIRARPVDDEPACWPNLAPPESPAMILYTSGTTSAPKGVMLSSQAVFAFLRSFVQALRLGPETVTLTGTPLAHLSGFVSGLALPAFLGSRSVILPRWDAGDAVRIIDAEGVDLMLGSPVFLQDLVGQYAHGVNVTRRLGVYLAAGAPCSPTLIRAADNLGIAASRCYGMTETAGSCTVAPQHATLDRRAECDGRLLDDMHIDAVDESGTPLPRGEVGRLRVRGPQLFARYTSTKGTADIDAEGWFYSADVGSIDADGWVRITGRLSDLVNRGGRKISAHEIETVIATHPDVHQVAVTAIPDARYGEAVGAWISVRADTQFAGFHAFVETLEAARLDREKFPAEWHLVEQIPYSVSGKIQKHRLAELPDLAAATAVNRG